MENTFEKTVVITEFAYDLSYITVKNIEKMGEVEEAELLKEWASNGIQLKLTLTKQ